MGTTKKEYSAAPPLHWPIDVPETSSPPEPFDVVAYANFLLTMLFQHKNGELRGEFSGDTGRWSVRLLPDGEELEIGRQDDLGIFRMVLARFGYWYMAVQLYGGSAQRPLMFKGRRYDCDITMSNRNGFGYSLALHASVHES
jgi:hypothetical protein